MALMARAYNQAQKFGVDMAIPDEAVGLELDEGDAGRHLLRLQNDERVSARSIVIATGARYRLLDLADLERFESSSVHYWASSVEGRLCAGQEVALVGGGNSAGQAAVYLAGRCAKVWLIVRSRNLASSMSRYLVDRIEGLGNVELVSKAQVTALEGEGGSLTAIRWRAGNAAEEVRRISRHPGRERLCANRQRRGERPPTNGDHLPRRVRDRRCSFWLGQAGRGGSR
jgi:thioredoxin reductase (NADPH)